LMIETFGSAEEADRALNRLARSKRRRGYEASGYDL
jgi:predicted DNA-binding WGR domain protein